MYRDNTLIPSEAIRLLALGLLANGDTTYAALAGQVRHFTSHIVGPSLDLVASPLELLKVEGLVEPVNGAGRGDEAVLRVTEPGREELRRLLTANVRAPVNDINKLIIALKMRFLHLLAPEERCLQAEMMIEMCERALARLIELREHHCEEPGHFVAWLDHDIAEMSGRLQWFQDLRSHVD